MRCSQLFLKRVSETVGFTDTAIVAVLYLVGLRNPVYFERHVLRLPYWPDTEK